MTEYNQQGRRRRKKHHGRNKARKAKKDAERRERKRWVLDHMEITCVLCGTKMDVTERITSGDMEFPSCLPCKEARSRG